MMPSILGTTIRYLQNTKKRAITQRELIEKVSKKTGCTRESVRGTIIGDANGKKLFGQVKFKKRWAVCVANKISGEKKRFVRRSDLQKGDVEAHISYDTPNKKAARERGLKYLKGPSPNVITLASKEGYCVKTILKRFPTAKIFNIERDQETLKAWKSKKIPTFNFQGDLVEFVHTPMFETRKFDLLNADLMSYASSRLHDMLSHLNELANVKIIVLTLSGIRNFRNTGKWVTAARLKYRSNDPTREWLLDVMRKYKMLDEWFYTRDPRGGSRAMRMFVLQREKV